MKTALFLLPVSLCAQWLDFRTPGIPRAADGKPNLTAPEPKTPDGKPDLSGIWRPEANPYFYDVIQELKDEAIFRPAAEALFLKRVAEFRRDGPQTHCLPRGPSDILFGASRRSPEHQSGSVEPADCGNFHQPVPAPSPGTARAPACRTPNIRRARVKNLVVDGLSS